MVKHGIADYRSDGAQVDWSTTPTGIADFDTEVNIPLYNDMQNMQGNLLRKRELIILNQMDKEGSKYKQKMVHFLEVFASFPGCYHYRQRC
jgi:hypothetical protein